MKTEAIRFEFMSRETPARQNSNLNLFGSNSDSKKVPARLLRPTVCGSKSWLNWFAGVDQVCEEEVRFQAMFKSSLNFQSLELGIIVATDAT